MALLGVQRINLVGVDPSLVVAADGGDEFANDGKTYLEVANGAVGAIDVTIDSQKPSNYGTDVDIVVSVPAGESRKIGPFNPDRFNDQNGRVHVSYSSAGSVTVGAFRL